jgi:hypothetical protein
MKRGAAAGPARRRPRAVILTAYLLSAGLAAPSAHAADPSPIQPSAGPSATFAIIVGANRSVDPELKPLLYADDDAVRYLMLFQSLGARTVLLTRPDANTSRVLPRAVAGAVPPRQENLAAAVAAIATDVRAARAKGLHTELYFLFAGHGNVEDGRAYLGLEDAKLTGADLDRDVLRPVGADQSHVVIDACYSYFLAHQRGPGGSTRVVRGFSESGGGLDRPDVGLLLSTSSGRESHEWDGFQAGVFSHEVRSGLYGAADIDGDGQIDYREIAAFIVRANAAIPNEQLRPDVYARPPRGDRRLLDLRPGQRRTLVVGAAIVAGHYLLEDRAGNRLVEFHGAPARALRLLRPDDDTVYLRNVDTGREYEIGGSAREITVAALADRPSPARTRGAAHNAFNLIFSMPFDDSAVAQYQFPEADLVGVAAPPAPASWRPRAALVAGALSAATAIGSGVFILSSRQHAQEAVDPMTSQADVASLNSAIDRDQRRALWLGAAAAVTAAGALGLWLWPEAKLAPSLAADDSAPVLGVSGRF